MYEKYSDLQEFEKVGYDYQIRATARGSGIAVMAPHGGKIEPGTSELAEAIAGLEYDFYAFEGKKKIGNTDLHITSTLFDEPGALRMARNSETVLTLHGYRGEGDIVFIGGLFDEMRYCVKEHLERSGFQTAENQLCRGVEPSNLCNRGRSAKGVQLELTRGLRCRMFEDGSLRDRTCPAELFRVFVGAVRNALSICAGARGLS